MRFPPLLASLVLWIFVTAGLTTNLPAQNPLPLFTDLWEKRLLANPQDLYPWEQVAQSWCGKPGWPALEARWAEEQKKQPRFAILRGRLAETQGKFDEALARYAEAPDDEQAVFQLGRLSALTGKIEPAEKAFRQLMERAADPQLRWKGLEALLQKTSLLGDFEEGRKLCLDYWTRHTDRDSREQVLSALVTFSARTGQTADLLTLCREEDERAGPSATATGYEKQAKELLLATPESVEGLLRRLAKERIPPPPGSRMLTANEMRQAYPRREKILAQAEKGGFKGEAALEGLAKLVIRPYSMWPGFWPESYENVPTLEPAQLEAYLRATADALKAYPLELACVLSLRGKEFQSSARELVEKIVFPGEKPALWAHGVVLMDLAGYRDIATVDKEAAQKQLLSLMEGIPAELPLARTNANSPYMFQRDGLQSLLASPGFIFMVQWNLTGGEAGVKFLQSWRRGDAGIIFPKNNFHPSWLNTSATWPRLERMDRGTDLLAWTWEALKALGEPDPKILETWLGRVSDPSLRLVLHARWGDPAGFLRRLAEAPSLEDLSTQALMTAKFTLMLLAPSRSERSVRVSLDAREVESQMLRVLQTLLARHPEWGAELRHNLWEYFQRLQVSDQLPAPPVLSEQDRKMLLYRFGMTSGAPDNHMLASYFPQMEKEALIRETDKIRGEYKAAKLPHPFDEFLWLPSAEQDSAFVLRVAQLAFSGGIKPALTREAMRNSPASREPSYGPNSMVDTSGSSMLQAIGLRALSPAECELLRRWETKHPWKKDLLRMAELLNGAPLVSPNGYSAGPFGPGLTREGQDALKQAGAESADPYFRAIRATLLLGEGKKEEAAAAFKACAVTEGPLSVLARLGPDIIFGKVTKPVFDPSRSPMAGILLQKGTESAPNLQAEQARIEQEWADATKRQAWEDEDKIKREMQLLTRAATPPQLITWLKSKSVPPEAELIKKRMLATALLQGRAPKAEVTAAMEEIRKVAPENPLVWQYDLGEWERDFKNPGKLVDAYVTWYHWDKDKRQNHKEPNLEIIWYRPGIGDSSINELLKVFIHRIQSDAVTTVKQPGGGQSHEISIWATWTATSDQQLWRAYLRQLREKRGALLFSSLERLTYDLNRIRNAGESELAAEFALAVLTVTRPKEAGATRIPGAVRFSDTRHELWQERGHIVSNPEPKCQAVELLGMARFRNRRQDVSEALRAAHKAHPDDEHLATYVLLDKGQENALTARDMDALKPLAEDEQVRVMERLRVILPGDRLPFGQMEALLEKEVLGLLRPRENDVRPDYQRIQSAARSLAQMSAYREGTLSPGMRKAICEVLAGRSVSTEEMRVLARAVLLHANEEQVEAFREAVSNPDSYYVSENFKALAYSIEEAMNCKHPGLAGQLSTIALAIVRRVLESRPQDSDARDEMLGQISLILSSLGRHKEVVDLHTAQARSLRKFGPVSALPRVLESRSHYAQLGKLPVPGGSLGEPLPQITPNARLSLGFPVKTFGFSHSGRLVGLTDGNQVAIVEGTGKKLTVLATERMPALEVFDPASNQIKTVAGAARSLCLMEVDRALIFGATAQGSGWMRVWNFAGKEAIGEEAVFLPAPLVAWCPNATRTHLGGILMKKGGQQNGMQAPPQPDAHVMVVLPSGKILTAVVPPLKYVDRVKRGPGIAAWAKDNSRVWAVVQDQTLVYEVGEDALRLVDKSDTFILQNEIPGEAVAAQGAYEYDDWVIDGELQLARADVKTGRVLGRVNPAMDNNKLAIGPFREADLLLQDTRTNILHRFSKADMEKALKEELERLK